MEGTVAVLSRVWPAPPRPDRVTGTRVEVAPFTKGTGMTASSVLTNAHADAGPSALEIKGLSVAYGGFRAVRDVDLSVPRGQVQGLIGPNGAGKTSCFNAICGYVRASAGSIRVHGQPVRIGNPSAAWKSGIGRTFQRVELFWALEVRDHLELARRRALRRGRSPLPVDELISLLGLADVEHVLAANLPLGTCRQLELARAICTGANLILMDEPCSGLDRHETAQLEVALRTAQEQLSLSLLIVEHDMEFILSVAQNLDVMDQGSIIARGTPAEIRANTQVRAAYLGTSDDAQAHPVADEEGAHA